MINDSTKKKNMEIWKKIMSSLKFKKAFFIYFYLNIALSQKKNEFQIPRSTIIFLLFILPKSST